ncbi:hypothetical protein P7C73_g9, partial [Tremellales sp. Uapishka_1]
MSQESNGTPPRLRTPPITPSAFIPKGVSAQHSNPPGRPAYRYTPSTPVPVRRSQKRSAANMLSTPSDSGDDSSTHPLDCERTPPRQIGRSLSRRYTDSLTLANQIELERQRVLNNVLNRTYGNYLPIDSTTPLRNGKIVNLLYRKAIDTKRYQKRSTPLVELPRMFDALNQDYVHPAHAITAAVIIHWIDPPGLYPHDIQARRMYIQLRNEENLQGDRIVWRSSFKCGLTCRREHRGKAGIDPQPEHHLLVEGVVRSRQGQDPKPEAKTKRVTCDAKLIIEMTVDDVRHGTCQVYTVKEKYHPSPLDLRVLGLSPSVRSWLHQTASMCGMTTSRLKIWCNKHLRDRNDHWKFLHQHQPSRLPQEHHYRTAIVTALAQTHVDSNPLGAIKLLADRNPSAFIAYECNLETLRTGNIPLDQDIKCIIAPPFALESALLFAIDRGLFMDSSWRNKNAFKCPLTIVSTLNDYGRMVPSVKPGQATIRLSRGMSTRSRKMQGILQSMKVIDHVNPGQQDSNELFDNTVRSLDQLCEHNSYSRIFETKTRYTWVCPNCKHLNLDIRNEPNDLGLSIVSQQLEYKEVEGCVPHMLQYQMNNSQSSTDERCLDCGKTFAVISYVGKASHGSFLTVAWGYYHNHSEAPDYIRTPDAFEVPSKMALTWMNADGSDQTTKFWKLAGAVCRSLNGSANVGHFVSVIYKDDSWWTINDSKARQHSTSRSALFDSGQTPYRLFYKIDSPLAGERNTYTSAPLKTIPRMVAEPFVEDDPSLLDGPITPIERDVIDRLSKVSWTDPTKVKPLVGAGSARFVLHDSDYKVIATAIGQDDITTYHLGSGARSARALFVSRPHGGAFNLHLGVETLQSIYRSEHAWWDDALIEDSVDMAKLTIAARDLSNPLDADDDTSAYQSNLKLGFLRPNYRRMGNETYNGELTNRFKEEWKPPWSSKNKPWQFLSDSWRKEVTIRRLHGKSHFAAMAVFGPQRLIVCFDSAGGVYDSPIMQKEWQNILQERMEWDVEMKKAELSDNEGWLRAPNTRRMASLIDYPQQVDSWSCGPMTAAALVLLVQGIRPTSVTMGLGEGKSLSRAGAIALRSSLLCLQLAVAADRTYDRRPSPALKFQAENSGSKETLALLSPSPVAKSKGVVWSENAAFKSKVFGRLPALEDLVRYA